MLGMTRLRLSNSSGPCRSVIAKLKKELYRRVLKSADEVRRLLNAIHRAFSHYACSMEAVDHNGRVFQETPSLFRAYPWKGLGGQRKKSTAKAHADCPGHIKTRKAGY